MIRNLIAVCLAGSLAACASTQTQGGKVGAPQARTPTEQYSVAVTHQPDEILLAPHAEGLSPHQVAALDGLVARWRDAGGESLLIKAPAAGGGDVFHATAAIQDRLESLGVDPRQIQLTGYETGGRAGAPVVVGFERYKAEDLKCNRSWGNLTHTINNEVDPNFGCTVTANIGAMVANPQDLVRPAPMGPPDAARRETVLGKYRAGAVTTSTKDDQANGAISTAIQ